MSEMTAREYLETKKRMCSSGNRCKDCDFYKAIGGVFCDDYQMDHPDEAIAIVQKWGKEHPVKTLMDKFFEVFPDAPKRDIGTPTTCPIYIGYDTEDCNGSDESCLKCWGKPYVEPKE